MARLDAARDLWPAAIGVSGGGDSVALMVLLARWAKSRHLPPPTILTVDHRLQPGSGEQAQAVVALAAGLGLECHVLLWRGKKPQSGIEGHAREARYRLMGNWCHKRRQGHRVSALYLAHSEDDQAETFLLRLARGSGLDGLAAMQPVAPFPLPGFAGLKLVRPLLGFSRDELRRFLTARRIPWHEDPMNGDERFARVRLRQALPVLDAAGLTPSRIAQAAAHLARARVALDAATDTLIAAATKAEKSRILLDGTLLLSAPREVGLRALARLLMQVSGQGYRPRFAALESLYDALREPGFAGRTLHGCKLARVPKRAAIYGAETFVLAREPGRKGPGRKEKSAKGKPEA